MSLTLAVVGRLGGSLIESRWFFEYVEHLDVALNRRFLDVLSNFRFGEKNDKSIKHIHLGCAAANLHFHPAALGSPLWLRPLQL